MLQELSSAIELIADRESVSRVVQDLRRQSRIAVDTESNSLHAYRERVCLIQCSTPEHDYVLDVLAVNEVSELGPLLADPHIEKVFHAAEYDLICLRRDFGFRCANIFDTMQAGRILGRKLAGLDRLLEDKLEVKVSKKLQKADWGQRPLTPELLAYAAQDTHFLIPLRDLLESDLRAKGLLELAQEDFRMACNPPELVVTERGASPSWSRLSARRDLTPQQLTVLRELVEWRESTAEKLDRPPFKVIGDEQLIQLARLQPTTEGDLASAGLSEKPRHQWGAELLRAVVRGRQNPPFHRQRSQRPPDTYLKRLDNLKEWRKKVAANMDVESDVVLPRGLLLALAEGGPERAETIMRPSPWRWQRFGAEISSVLQRVSSV